MERLPLCAAIMVAFLLVHGYASPSRAFSPGFVENKGQVRGPAHFYRLGSTASVYFTPDGITIALRERMESHERESSAKRFEDVSLGRPRVSRRGCAVHLRIEGAPQSLHIEGRDALDTQYNYFLGNDPRLWRTEVPVYQEVVYRDVRPGIDLAFRNIDCGLTYELVPAASASPVAVSFECSGADNVMPDGDGELLVNTAIGSLRIVTQGTGTAGQIVLPDASREESGLGTQRGNDPSLLSWSTLMGGWDGDQGFDIALDASGNVLVIGQTWSWDFPNTAGLYEFSGIADVFVSKLTPTGSSLLWSTFLGGTGYDFGSALTVDALDNPVVTGQASSGFPTTPGAYDGSLGGSSDAFVAKLSASGSALLWSTLLGGNELDSGRALALDGSGNVALTGITFSSGFPTTPGAYDRTYNGYYDAFVAKLSVDGSSLSWSTFLGGSGMESGLGLRLDPWRDVVVAGYTESSNFPTSPGAYDGSFNGVRDAFVAKLSSAGASVVWSTLLGGTANDAALGITLDASANPIVTGETYSSDFPTTPGAFDRSFNGGQTDAFVLRLSSVGSRLLWSTFLGGASHEFGSAVELDTFGSTVVAGYTESSDFPVTPDAYDESFNGYLDAFVTKFSPPTLDVKRTPSLSWSSFLGGNSVDGGLGLTLDAFGNAVVTGEAAAGFPTTPGAYDDSPNGWVDAFVVNLALASLAAKVGWGAHSERALLPRPAGRSQPSTAIRFSLDQNERVALRIYDIAGRCVATLFDGVATAGEHEMIWDGGSTSSAEPASGVYFYQLKTPQTSLTGKIVRLRR